MSSGKAEPSILCSRKFVAYSAQMSIEDTKLQTSSTDQWATVCVSGAVEHGFSPGVEHKDIQEAAVVVGVGSRDDAASVDVGVGTVASFDLGFGETLPVRFACKRSLVVLCKAFSMGKFNRASDPYRLSLKLGACFLDFFMTGARELDDKSNGLFDGSVGRLIAPFKYVSNWLALWALAVLTMLSNACVELISIMGGNNGTLPGTLGCANGFSPKLANNACCPSAGVGTLCLTSAVSGVSLVEALDGVVAVGCTVDGEVVLVVVAPSGANSPTNGVAAPGLNDANLGSDRPVGKPFLCELK